jgi:hypothetical protein
MGDRIWRRRPAVGVGGGITGFGAKLVIIDDRSSRAEAESKTYRERVWDWFNDDIYTRLEPDAAIILIKPAGTKTTSQADSSNKCQTVVNIGR